MKSVIAVLSFVLVSGTTVQALPPSPVATLPLSAALIPIHGCHSIYGHDIRGWHRHGKHCEAQRGLARTKRDKKRAI